MKCILLLIAIMGGFLSFNSSAYEYTLPPVVNGPMFHDATVDSNGYFNTTWYGVPYICFNCTFNDDGKTASGTWYRNDGSYDVPFPDKKPDTKPDQPDTDKPDIKPDIPDTSNPDITPPSGGGGPSVDSHSMPPVNDLAELSKAETPGVRNFICTKRGNTDWVIMPNIKHVDDGHIKGTYGEYMGCYYYLSLSNYNDDGTLCDPRIDHSCLGVWVAYTAVDQSYHKPDSGADSGDSDSSGDSGSENPGTGGGHGSGGSGQGGGNTDGDGDALLKEVRAFHRDVNAYSEGAKDSQDKITGLLGNVDDGIKSFHQDYKDSLKDDKDSANKISDLLDSFSSDFESKSNSAINSLIGSLEKYAPGLKGFGLPDGFYSNGGRCVPLDMSFTVSLPFYNYSAPVNLSTDKLCKSYDGYPRELLRLLIYMLTAFVLIVLLKQSLK
ncbi:hypothetical protein RE773_000397 [Salmonella enterica]|nr:hypothetical protein [Salmonella enterica]EKY8868054.1 hypothetical protein [Salmonella enterica]EKY8978672.1 hypothetical protein [Salmonella enterica]EKZ8156289.1 hypothetical protein [Salmonella enterica]ELF2381137.1 hypothetical protein [Salmonella enterica]